MKEIYMNCTKSKETPSKKQVCEWVKNVNASP